MMVLEPWQKREEVEQHCGQQEWMERNQREEEAELEQVLVQQGDDPELDAQIGAQR